MSHQDLREESWDISRRGSRCLLCSPREPNNEYRLEIASLSISTLYLFRDQRFRGYSLLIFNRRHATAMEELTDEEYRAYMHDLRLAAMAIRSALKPDHMNYECLGNTSPHLHWHIVPRFKNDPRWGQPIWEGWQRKEFNVHRVVLTDSEYVGIIERIRANLMAVEV